MTFSYLPGSRWVAKTRFERPTLRQNKLPTLGQKRKIQKSLGMPVITPWHGFQKQDGSTRPQLLGRSLPLHRICPEAPPPWGKTLGNVTGQNPLEMAYFISNWVGACSCSTTAQPVLQGREQLPQNCVSTNEGEEKQDSCFPCDLTGLTDALADGFNERRPTAEAGTKKRECKSYFGWNISCPRRFLPRTWSSLGPVRCRATVRRRQLKPSLSPFIDENPDVKNYTGGTRNMLVATEQTQRTSTTLQLCRPMLSNELHTTKAIWKQNGDRYKQIGGKTKKPRLFVVTSITNFKPLDIFLWTARCCSYNCLATATSVALWGLCSRILLFLQGTVRLSNLPKVTHESLTEQTVWKSPRLTL